MKELFPQESEGKVSLHGGQACLFTQTRVILLSRQLDRYPGHGHLRWTKLQLDT